MPIVELKLADMEAGKLHAHFTCGAAAVILHGAGAINRLWSSLLENREETLPWEASLAEFAQNHHGTADITTSLGDVFYFQPGQHGYIARKIEIEASDRSGKLSSNPDSFIQPAGVFHIPQQQLQDIFGLSV
tara:strand:+ start:882 stop:1277 length:396 start_codon:yes stop_codon:yes gene_type:complete